MMLTTIKLFLSYFFTKAYNLFSVALVIPFRDRDAHLHIFLHHLIPMLMRQQLEFTIYVVDQVSVAPPPALHVQVHPSIVSDGKTS